MAAPIKPSPAVWQPGSAPAGCNLYALLHEGTGTTTDNLAGTDDGTFVGSPTWGTGTYGPEVGGFTSSNMIGYSPASQLVATGSYPFWIGAMFKNTSTNAGDIIGFGSTSSNSPKVLLRINTSGNAGQFLYWANGNSFDGPFANATGLTCNDGNYHTVFGVSTSATAHALLFDGTQVATDTTSLGTCTLNTYRIGGYLRSAGDVPFPFSHANSKVAWAGCGQGAAPDFAALHTDLITGTFAAARPAAGGGLILFGGGDLSGGLGGLSGGLQ